MPNDRIITTHEASIKTVTVEVKTLTISGKQMTLSVFRQLVREDLFDFATGGLRGVPWGLVNYFPDGCSPSHLHVVWLLGEQLRRACVWHPDNYRELSRIYTNKDHCYKPDSNEEVARKELRNKILLAERAVIAKFYEQIAALPQFFIAV